MFVEGTVCGESGLRKQEKKRKDGELSVFLLGKSAVDSLHRTHTRAYTTL